MNKHHLGAAFRYSYRDTLKSALIFISAMIVIFAANIIISSHSSGNIVTHISYFDFAGCVMIFVLGICSIRDDMRLLIQHGVGRTTSFITNILTALMTALLLTFAGEIIVGIAQLITAPMGNIEVPLFYQFYSNSSGIAAFGDYLWSAAMTIPIYLAVYLLGMAISLLFYRLPKPWKIGVGVGVPVLCFVILPIAGSYHESLLDAVVTPMSRLTAFCFAAPGNMIITALAAALICAACAWLLFRRAPIK